MCIRDRARAPYVLLLNNDTEVEPDFLKEMTEGLQRHKKAFSCQAKMLQFHDREKMDDGGNYYCALGWAFAGGKGKSAKHYDKEKKIFSSCAGAAIYRKKIFEKIGYFDDEHFAYLEDLDVGYRARIYGYENWYIPGGVVYHVGSLSLIHIYMVPVLPCRCSACPKDIMYLSFANPVSYTHLVQIFVQEMDWDIRLIRLCL